MTNTYRHARMKMAILLAIMVVCSNAQMLPFTLHLPLRDRETKLAKGGCDELKCIGECVEVLHGSKGRHFECSKIE